MTKAEVDQSAAPRFLTVVVRDGGTVVDIAATRSNVIQQACALLIADGGVVAARARLQRELAAHVAVVCHDRGVDYQRRQCELLQLAVLIGTGIPTESGDQP